jgi:hypothetical protein
MPTIDVGSHRPTAERQQFTPTLASAAVPWQSCSARHLPARLRQPRHGRQRVTPRRGPLPASAQRRRGLGLHPCSPKARRQHPREITYPTSAMNAGTKWTRNARHRRGHVPQIGSGTSAPMDCRSPDAIGPARYRHGLDHYLSLSEAVVVREQARRPRSASARQQTVELTTASS